MLTQNRDEAADLLRAALTEPAFSPVAIERVRGQVISIIEGDAQDPHEIASNTFNALAFGDHPYGSAAGGHGRDGNRPDPRRSDRGPSRGPDPRSALSWAPPVTSRPKSWAC
jgi:hypothetical protein